MSYIICFWDKSKLQVNNEVGIKLQEAIMTKSVDNFKLGNNLYSIKGVEKIITKGDAFNVFPTEWQTLKNMEDQTATLPTLESPKLHD